MNSGPITLAIVGAGNRGRDTNGRWCLNHPEQARVVVVAETDASRRWTLAVEHSIGPEATVGDWRGLLSTGRLADAVVIAWSSCQAERPPAEADRLPTHGQDDHGPARHARPAA